MTRPLCIDLFCGLGGWAEGFLAEGYDVIGFDVERHDYGKGVYPGQLVLQDVLTLHGSQFRHAAVIVASPPCQEYSYMAMPWSLAKQKREEYRNGTRKIEDLNRLFDACFRIQREASEAAGRHIPLVVENVKGAQPWVGRAKWHYGSFYLWGDVPALMPIAAGRKSQHKPLAETPAGTGKTSWFFGNSKHEGRYYGTKNNGGSWFNVGSPGQKETGQNPVNGRKGDGGSWFGDYQAQKAAQDGIKQGGRCWRWHDSGSMSRRYSSKSNARKAASAMIAKIPFPLAQHVAQVFKPEV